MLCNNHLPALQQFIDDDVLMGDLARETVGGVEIHGVEDVSLRVLAQFLVRAVRSRIMQFHANSVSTSVFADDYCQVIFEAEDDADDLPYLLIQRKRPIFPAFHLAVPGEIVCPLTGKLRGADGERYGALWS